MQKSFGWEVSHSTTRPWWYVPSGSFARWTRGGAKFAHNNNQSTIQLIRVYLRFQHSSGMLPLNGLVLGVNHSASDCTDPRRLLVLLLSITGSAQVGRNQISCRHQGERIRFPRQLYSPIPACQIKSNHTVYIRFSCVLFVVSYDPFNAVRRRCRLWISTVNRSFLVVTLAWFVSRREATLDVVVLRMKDASPINSHACLLDACMEA